MILYVFFSFKYTICSLDTYERKRTAICDCFEETVVYVSICDYLPKCKERCMHNCIQGKLWRGWKMRVMSASLS